MGRTGGCGAHACCNGVDVQVGVVVVTRGAMVPDGTVV
jgi:hypothetical protein